MMNAYVTPMKVTVPNIFGVRRAPRTPGGIVADVFDLHAAV